MAAAEPPAPKKVATVEGKRISLTLAVKDSGLYRLVVELREDLQEPDLLASIKKSPVGKWSFDQATWGDDFVNLPGPKLREFEQQTDLAISLILSGCSVKQYAINKLGDSLAKSGTSYASDNDPELVGAALPFSLKLIEGCSFAEIASLIGVSEAAAKMRFQRGLAAVRRELERQGIQP